MRSLHTSPHASNNAQSELEPISNSHEVSSDRDPCATTLATRLTTTNQGSCHKRRGSLFGITSVCGHRREMEDAVTAISSFIHLSCDTVGGCSNRCLEASEFESAFAFYGVYDGHGGSQASLFCKTRLHLAVAEEVKVLNKGGNSSLLSNWKLQWQNIMTASFLQVDAEAGAECYDGSKCIKCQEHGACSGTVVPESAGSTAVVAIIGLCQIIVSNCGDSRAVLSRNGKAIPLSNDHKPDRADEMARIEAAGGRVIYWNGYRVLGILAMSRAIGDRYLKPYVIAKPEVTCLQRSDEDEFLILASDGLWDVFSNESACDLVRRCFLGGGASGSSLKGSNTKESAAATAAAFLTKVALSRGSHDNITVVVVDLKTKR